MYSLVTISIKQSKETVKKIVKRHVISADLNGPISLKRRKQSTTKEIKNKQFSAPLTVGNINLLYDIPKIDNVCAGLNFCVLNTAKNKPTLEQLQCMILRHGGNVVQTPSKTTFVCIAGTESLKVTLLKDTKHYNIATVDWLLRALGANVPLKKLLNFHPSDMLCYTNELSAKFQKKYDKYSDSFTKKVSSCQLRGVLDAMDEKELETLTRSEIYEIEIQLANQSRPSNMFRLATAIFYKNTDKNQKNVKLAKQIFKFRGGKVLDSFDVSQLSHVFVDCENFDVNSFTLDFSVGSNNPIQETSKYIFVRHTSCTHVKWEMSEVGN